jgi:hypothetical protein
VKINRRRFFAGLAAVALFSYFMSRVGPASDMPAPTTPPALNVIAGVSDGFDLICYSGGKVLRDSHGTASLPGRAHRIRVARRHAARNDISIGRGVKVTAEECPGTLVRTDVFVPKGHTKEIHFGVDWDADIIDLDSEALVQVLRDHDPSVEVRACMFSGARMQLSATVMDEVEDRVASQINREILPAHS